MSLSKEETVTYNVSITTDDAYSEAGTNSSVYIEFVGEDGKSTGWHNMDHFWSNDFERGQVNHFKLTAPSVGLPLIVRIKLEHGRGEDEWLCDRIVVKLNNKRVEFPVYDWIEHQLEVTRGEAMLPQKVDNQYVRSLRQQEVDERKVLFAWSPRPTQTELGWGMNRVLGAAVYDDLPRFLKRDEVRNSDLQRSRFTALLQSYAHRITSTVLGLNTLEDYHRLYKHHDLQRAKANALDGWDTDEGMGRLTLNGISPLSFYRCSELPEGFNVTTADLKGLLREGKTLEDEMEAGLIYVSDYYKHLEGISRNTDFDGNQIYCANAMGMFYVRPDKKFVPIAIQLVPGDRDYLFTSLDSKDEWLLAKMYFRCAEGNFHQWIVHYVNTHGIIETIGIACFRCLPRSHPVHKLLRPHVKNVAAINIDARQNLIPPSGKANKALAISASELARKNYKTFNFGDLMIPNYIKKLGLDDPELLPYYYYRDDVLELWEIMRKYVGSVLKVYYKCDEDVREDFELQDWIRDVAVEGVAWQDGDYRGVPDHIDTLEQLIDICHTVIFTSSAQHSAVNFGQFDTYKYIPSATGGMMLPPHRRGEGTMERIMTSLPGVRVSGTFIAFAFILSTYSDSEVFLGNFPQRLFTDEETMQCQRDFKADLEVFSEKIKERNLKLDHPYTYLLPERIPNGTSI
uniref:Arachidonate 5-lipoxygenase-like n=1 Tax=Phallusia mammillata TaxID=59560 RepID=A0A6F9D6X6_9ASCI|nr:arachidonate 5-lipoxygenase-like [Phallusia mammillata]